VHESALNGCETMKRSAEPDVEDSHGAICQCSEREAIERHFTAG
jgi:hypothetical protein